MSLLSYCHGSDSHEVFFVADEAEYIEEQKKLRRLVKLPVTKALVYYKHPYHIGDSPFSVINFNAEKFKRNGKEYDWYMVTIQVMELKTRSEFMAIILLKCRNRTLLSNRLNLMRTRVRKSNNRRKLPTNPKDIHTFL